MRLTFHRRLWAAAVASAALTFAAAGPANAASAWKEARKGDLSNDRLAPTLVQVVAGGNAVHGTTGNDGRGVDRDYFRFVVPEGYELAAIRLLRDTSVSGGASFIAIEKGEQITCTETGQGVEDLLGFAHYGNDQIGTDILPGMLIGATAPLPAGPYAFWVQDTGGPATYGLNFVIRRAKP
jgi:hypothetical protein